MENILKHIDTFKFLYLIIFIIIILIIILIVLLKKKNKKIEPISLEKIEETEVKSDIEEVIAAMESNLNDRKMTTFEQEQEENAIISYQELVNAVNEKKAKSQSINEKIIIEEDLNDDNDLKEEEIILEEEIKESKFKSSEFISPVFGKDNNKTNDDFLKELKDFRKNL